MHRTKMTGLPLIAFLTLLLAFFFSEECLAVDSLGTSNTKLKRSGEAENTCAFLRKTSMLKTQKRVPGNLFSLLRVDQEDTVRAKTSPSPAETHLGWLAKKSTADRKRTSNLAMLVGVAVTALSIFDASNHAADDEDIGDQLVIAGSGLALTAIGFKLKYSRSGAERAFDEFQGITDPYTKEIYGHRALKSLADGAKTKRIVGGVLCAIASALTFSHEPYPPSQEASVVKYVTGVILASFAIAGFAEQSDEEKVLKRYLEDKKKSELGIRHSIRARPGLAVCLRLPN